MTGNEPIILPYQVISFTKTNVLHPDPHSVTGWGDNYMLVMGPLDHLKWSKKAKLQVLNELINLYLNFLPMF